MMLLQIISLHIAEDFQFEHFGKVSYSTSCLPISWNICSFFATEFNMFNQKSIKSTGLFFFLYYTVCISNKSIFQIEVNIEQIIYQSNTLQFFKMLESHNSDIIDTFLGGTKSDMNDSLQLKHLLQLLSV